MVARQGDYYGEVVNLASRLADLAIPGEVLADDNVRVAAHDSALVFEGAGRRQLKGFDEPVLAFSVLRPPRQGGHRTDRRHGPGERPIERRARGERSPTRPPRRAGRCCGSRRRERG